MKFTKNRGAADFVLLGELPAMHMVAQSRAAVGRLRLWPFGSSWDGEHVYGEPLRAPPSEFTASREFSLRITDGMTVYRAVP